MKTRTAIGYLVGFESTLFSEGVRLKNKWMAHGIIITLDEFTIEFGFLNKDFHYKLTGTHIKNDYYEASIYCDEKKCGKFNVRVYANEKGCILLGQWNENDVENEVWGEFDWKN